MADIMVTYRSFNAPPGQEWLGYIHTGAGRLDISFMASTEEELKQEMKKFWAKDKAVRDANRAKRAEAKARKKKDDA